MISYLKENYAGTLAARYEVEETVEHPVELLEAIAQKRGCVQRGNEIDYSKAAALVIDDFRSGRLGRSPAGITGGRIMEVRKIGEIEEELKATADTELSEFIRRYAADERAGVRTMLAQAQKRQEKYEKEILRIEALKVYERKYADYALICGIDEVGRGPLAGPVVAGAVILPKDCNILYINDSKKLSEKKREELYDVIMERAVATGIGMASPARIDEINILQATYEAMREAISKLDPQPDLLLNDAVTIPQVEIHQVPIIKGDAKSISIGAAASIIAKVTRDRLMVEYDKVMPEYGFASNKGYGSAAHIDALKKYGATPIHRRSFIHNFISVEKTPTSAR